MLRFISASKFSIMSINFFLIKVSSTSKSFYFPSQQFFLMV